MINLNESAHSSDRLEIVYLDSRACVKKTFINGSQRAIKNIEKQKKFQSIKTSSLSIAAVPVINFSSSSEGACLLMPYIEGISGDEFSVRSTASVVEDISNAFSAILDCQMKSICHEQIYQDCFVMKIDEVISQTNSGSLNSALSEVRKLILRLPKTLDFPMGNCHGDLTLSNIILTPGSGIFLMDFLYTFLETPLQDVAKLKQDFMYGWSFRKCHSHLQLKSQIFCQYAYPKKILELEALYPIQIELLTLLTLARIAPYVRDTKTEFWLLNSLKIAIENFKL